ncbi:MAG: MBL fold metallo-hydrolase [Stagnimonas sp.]|nr:MBL fold metallo-hydrolase [Stagnimonas sp.]
MRILRWLFWARLVLVLVLGLAALGLSRLPWVQDRVFLAVAKHSLGRSYEHYFDGQRLSVIVCGSSSPLPDPNREQACLLVMAGDRYYLVDAGPGSPRNLGLWNIPREKLAGVFITHLHSDHMGGLAEMRLQSWASGRKGALPVYGPPGIERVVGGFNEAYAIDTDYRVRHHGPGFLHPDDARMEARPVVLPEPASPAKDRQTVVLEQDGLKVTAIEIDHKVVAPAYAYRFDYRGRSLVISGDTAYHPPLAVASRGADVLLHEANATHMEALIHQAVAATPRANQRFAQLHREINDYHTSPVEAARIANQAEVPLLVLYHLMPPIHTRLQLPMFLRGVGAIRPRGVEVAEDGLLIELPAGGREIIEDSLP